MDSRLKVLDLSSNKLGLAAGLVIAEALKVNTLLTGVNLKDNNLGDKGWCAIFDALRDNKDIKISKWDLADQGINPTISKSLAAYVAVSILLTCLDVHSNEIGPKGGKVIAEALKRNDSLSTLDIAGNMLGPNGGVAIAEALGVKSSLTSLNLSSNMLGSEGGAAVADALKVNGHLISLDVCNNGIAGNAAQQLAAAVLGKQTLDIFCHIPLKELRADTPITLDLTGKGIGVPAALVLAKLLQTSVSGSLTKLTLVNNSAIAMVCGGVEGNAVTLLRCGLYPI